MLASIILSLQFANRMGTLPTTPPGGRVAKMPTSTFERSKLKVNLESECIDVSNLWTWTTALNLYYSAKTSYSRLGLRNVRVRMSQFKSSAR